MRFLFILLIAGAALCWFGCQEFRVSYGTSTEPVEIALFQLEDGEELPNNHIKFGDHLSLYSQSVLSYSTVKGGNGVPAPDTKVNFVYYPILSAAVVANEDIAVVVKTKRFKTFGEVPKDDQQQRSVKGLVINRIGSLSKEEEDLIHEGVPGINLKKVLILEENRVPSALYFSLGMVAAGVILILITLMVFFGSGKDA